MADEDIRSPGLPPDEPAEAPTDTMIDRWFADHFHGSIVSRHTDVYSHVFAAKEALKRLLKGQS